MPFWLTPWFRSNAVEVYISNECSNRRAPLDIGELHQVYRRRTHSRTRGKGARLNMPRVVDHADGGHARVELLGHLGQHLGSAMSGVKTSMMRSGGTLGGPKALGQVSARSGWSGRLAGHYLWSPPIPVGYGSHSRQGRWSSAFGSWLPHQKE